jgi:uncharacterized protein YebE (UPF0316 family)
LEFDATILLAALFVFVLRVASAALAALRTLVMARGAETASALLGFFEVLVYVVSFGLVVSDMTNVSIVLAYCAGFAVGTVVGIRLERRLALGVVTLRIISRSKAEDVSHGLRDAGIGATLSWGEGRDGPVGIVQSVVARKHAARAQALVRDLDPGAFVVADEARAVTAGWLQGPTFSVIREQK